MNLRAGAVGTVLAASMTWTTWLAPVPAMGIDQGKGSPGHCTSNQGVTVVVDFGKLGGTPLVRCNPSTTRGTGLDALKGAGFQISGVQRWGESFICRIENRPSAVEPVPIEGDADYRERCVDTPPASGYWSYWHAGNNCAWEYSQWGVKNRDFVPGGFEGWSFSLNAEADRNPEPRIAAVRPGTQGRPCNAPDEAAPASNDPDERQSAPDAPSDEDATTEGLPAPKPRPITTVPTSAPSAGVGGAEFSGGADAPDVNDTIEDQSGASGYAPWAAAAAVVVLGAAMVLTSRRRRQARDL